MKLPTINQINGRLLNQPAINEYLYQSSDEQRYSNHYKQRYFNFCYENSKGVKVNRNLSIVGNFLFCAALKEKENVIKTKDNYHTTNKPTIKLWLKGIYFEITTKIEFTGVYLKVRSNSRIFDLKPEYYREDVYFTIKVSSNKTFEDFNQEQYFLNYLNKKYLYPAGLFREIQITFNLTKKEVPVKYRELLKASKEVQPESIDVNKAIIRRLNKKLNIIVDPYVIIQDYKLLKLLKEQKRYTKKVTATRQPSMFEILEAASYEQDTDEGIFEYANEVLSEYEDKILI